MKCAVDEIALNFRAVCIKDYFIICIFIKNMTEIISVFSAQWMSLSLSSSLSLGVRNNIGYWELETDFIAVFIIFFNNNDVHRVKNRSLWLWIWMKRNDCSTLKLIWLMIKYANDCRFFLKKDFLIVDKVENTDWI